MLYTIKVFYVSNKTLMLPNDKEKSVTVSNNSSDAHTTGARSVTRRNLTRGALWAVPAIADSTAVPVFAVSADDCKAVQGPDFTHGEIIDRQIFTTDPTGKAAVMTRNGKTQTVRGQVIPFASSMNDQATDISARFALCGDKLMEGMYQFEVVITVPTIHENGTVDTNKQVNAIAFTPPTFNMVSS